MKVKERDQVRVQLLINPTFQNECGGELVLPKEQENVKVWDETNEMKGKIQQVNYKSIGKVCGLESETTELIVKEIIKAVVRFVTRLKPIGLTCEQRTKHSAKF